MNRYAKGGNEGKSVGNIRGMMREWRDFRLNNKVSETHQVLLRIFTKIYQQHDLFPRLEWAAVDTDCVRNPS